MWKFYSGYKNDYANTYSTDLPIIMIVFFSYGPDVGENYITTAAAPI